jgi:hypothetical protein
MWGSVLSNFFPNNAPRRLLEKSTSGKDQRRPLFGCPVVQSEHATSYTLSVLLAFLSRTTSLHQVFFDTPNTPFVLLSRNGTYS